MAVFKVSRIITDELIYQSSEGDGQTFLLIILSKKYDYLSKSEKRRIRDIFQRIVREDYELEGFIVTLWRTREGVFTVSNFLAPNGTHRFFTDFFENHSFKDVQKHFIKKILVSDSLIDASFENRDNSSVWRLVILVVIILGLLYFFLQ